MKKDTITMLVVIAVLVPLITMFTVYLTQKSNDLEADVKAGSKELHCSFYSGKKKVEPTKIVSKEGNTWVFTNGYSSHCTVKDKEL